MQRQGTEMFIQADDEAGEMERFGITCIPVNVFHWRGYRYGNLQEAIAAAARAAALEARTDTQNA